MQLTKEIITPIGKHKVEIRTMLTGAQREAVDNAQMDYVETSDGQTFKVKDMKKVGLAQKHKLLEVSVVQIDEDATTVLERLQKMYEPDYDFVYNEIIDAQKKMKSSTSEVSS